LIYAHPTFVEPMLDYIVTDFEKSRGVLNDGSIGGMVICDSSDQARRMFEIFNAKYAKSTIPASEPANDEEYSFLKAAETKGSYQAQQKQNHRVTSAKSLMPPIKPISTSYKLSWAMR